MKISNKKKVRKEILQLRNGLDKRLVSYYSNQIIDKITNDINYQNSKIIGIYMPINNEIDLLDLLKDKSKQFVVPKIEGTEIVFIKIDEKTNYISNQYKILEPTNGNRVNHIDYLITPAVAINKNFRLGYGGGYYDRYLANHRPNYVVGVIYHFQEVDFEIDIHDQKLDYFFKTSEATKWIHA